MRRLADRRRIESFLTAIAGATRQPVSIHLVGGATAVLMGWRESTIDIDLTMVPEQDAILRAIPELKERLQINVELASPGDFIPVPDGWPERGRYITTIGQVTFYHYDLYAQALAKVERGHARDLADVRAMLERGVIAAASARRYFDRIEPLLYRFPAIDPATFRRAVDQAFPEAVNGER